MVDDQIRKVAEIHKVDVSPLERAARFSVEEITGFRDALKAKFDASEHDQLDVVLTGSFARHDLTADSDCDYLVVVHETIDPRTAARFLNETRNIADSRGFRPPGQQGLFGDFVTANELVARIGLEGDTNTNLTRRVLLLAESVSVFQPGLRTRINETILDRYCADYDPRYRDDAAEDVEVPRFLLNDLVRYWRTMTVDFGAKQWRELRPNWFLRHAKLLITRKILFAGSLAALYRAGCHFRAHEGDPYTILKQRLLEDMDRPPLARLLLLHDDVSEETQAALASILQAYARFLNHLSDADARSALAEPPTEENSALREEVEGLAGQVQSGLEGVFFDNQTLYQLTRRYALF